VKVKPEEKQTAFLDAYLPAHARLERYVRSLTRDEEEARDVTADTILEAYERFDSLRDQGAFLSFVFTIAKRRLGRLRWRRRLFRRLDTEIAADFPALAEVSPDSAADARLLRDALHRLPPAMREAVVLHELADLPLESVAGIQKATLSAVKQRVRRGRIRLARLLGVEKNSSNDSPVNPGVSRDEAPRIAGEDGLLP